MDAADHTLPEATASPVQHTSSGSAAAATTGAPRDSATLDTSLDSDAQTVIEKDTNGFTYFPCRFCGLTFNYMNTLRAHERVHDVAQPFKCGACGEAFHYACELEYHAQSHKDNNGYACDCGRRFYTYTELIYHKHPEDGVTGAAGGGEMPEIMAAPSTSSHPLLSPSLAHPLAVTERDFPTPAFALEGYEPRLPTKVFSDIRSRPYICEYCSKSYPDSRQLATHMNAHRGERSFNPRASRYLMGRNGVGYTERQSHFLY